MNEADLGFAAKAAHLRRIADDYPDSPGVARAIGLARKIEDALKSEIEGHAVNASR